jgi:hypothetical protein
MNGRIDVTAPVNARLNACGNPIHHARLRIASHEFAGSQELIVDNREKG